MFTLAISCLTTSNLPWFMDLTFQVPVQYCSLQHRALLLPPDSFTMGLCFCLGSDSSSPLELFLCSSPVAYWTLPTWNIHTVSVISFCLLILLVGFSGQKWWSGLPFPSPVNVLSELSTMALPSWVSLHGMAHCFIELGKVVVHVVTLVSFLWLWFSFCLPSDGWG